MSLVQVYKKYQKRAKQGYEFTPIGELLSDLLGAMNQRQWKVATREAREKSKEKP